MDHFSRPADEKVNKRLTSTRFHEGVQPDHEGERLIHLKSDSPFHTYTGDDPENELSCCMIPTICIIPDGG